MGQALFDGTFSTEAVAAAGHAVVDRLHTEAMATIASLAENWDTPVEDTPAVEGDAPVAFENPATWSVEDEDDDEIRVLQAFELPALLARPRPAAPIEVPAEVPADDEARALETVDAVDTDQFAVQTRPRDDRPSVAA
ncbi:hypothetical protein [Modestobacter marinus]|uniref:hypothetical protein n=1 Tax=Modestobacter marinus TaxID=477641 RepID=UPI001C98C7B0|nr:hypothetical protein [Modestobacter marinus]